jgi:TonB family protein
MKSFLAFPLLLACVGACAVAGGLKSEPDRSGVPRSKTQSPVVDPTIEFDAKGVDFTPWLRGFLARVRSHWFITSSAVSQSKGHVVITFRVQKNGDITDLLVREPSSVAAFNDSAYRAVVNSNPLASLPSSYPSESAFFTVTFYYNESPSSQRR